MRRSSIEGSPAGLRTFMFVPKKNEGCLQVCCSAACFCRLPAALSRGFNSSFTSARMYPNRCRPLVLAVVGQVMLGVPFFKCPLCYNSNIIFCWGLFP